MKARRAKSSSEKKYLRRMREAYLDSTMRSLSDAYGRYSDDKKEAWKDCVDLCEQMKGMDLRIIKRNKFMFSAGFVALIDLNICFVLITKNSVRYIEL